MKVDFDAANVEHRRAFNQFLRENSWGNVPYRFNHRGYGNTLAIMQRELLAFYSDSEFSAVKESS